MKIRAIIQARMGSSRLPGKSLTPINEVTLLKRVFNTVLNLEITDDIVIATTDLEEDDPIESYCSNYLNAKTIRGSSNNVLSRFLDACIDLDDEDSIIRFTADNIFYQKEICNNLLEIHIENNLDYTGIKGLSQISCELIKVGALRKTLNKELTDYDREHVTPYFINNSKMFKTVIVDRNEFGLKKKYDILLSIDTRKDRKRIEKLIEIFDNSDISFTREKLYNWLNNNKKYI